MSFLNATAPRLASLPAYLIIGIDGYRHLLAQLEEVMDEKVDVQTLMAELIEAVRHQRSALEEIEYHCLGLLEEHRFGNLHHQFEPLMDYVHYVGKQTYRGLCDHGAYLDGELPYQLYRVRPNGLYFQRKDLFQQEVQRDLDHQNEILHSTRLPAGVERAFQRGRADERHPLVYRLAL